MTEVSTTVPATSVKQAPSQATRQSMGMKWMSSKQNLPSLLNNYNSTAQLQKNLIFPNIKKSMSLLNLRAKVTNKFAFISFIFY